MLKNKKSTLRILRLTLLGCAVFFQVVSTAFAQNKTFRAGAAITNITPPLGLGLVGYFGDPPLAAHVHDELHARCLVLDDGTTKLAFVIADNVGINREVFDAAKRMIARETGIPSGQIMMAATHTHSSVSARGEGRKGGSYNYDKPLDDYQLFLAKRMADGVRIALNNLAPAKIGWGVGNAPQHLFNRRWRMKEKVPNPFGEMDEVLFNPGVTNENKKEPAGPIDPDVSFLSVQSVDGRPIALLANYSLHYVGGVPKTDISADYFAVFADRIQELIGADRQSPPFVGILTNGTSGDVNNVDFSRKTKSYPPYEKMKIVAHDLADEVLRVYKAIPYQDWVELRAAQSELTLAVRKASPEQLARARKLVAQPEGTETPHRHDRDYAARTIQIEEEWPDKVRVPMQVFRIGELGIAAIPFEVFTEIGLEIKAKSNAKTTFTIELANGWYGYLPTPEQHKLGGYETWLGTNRVEKEASRKIVAEILALFERVK